MMAQACVVPCLTRATATLTEAYTSKWTHVDRLQLSENSAGNFTLSIIFSQPGTGIPACGLPMFLAAPARLLAELVGQYVCCSSLCPCPLLPQPGELHNTVLDSAYWSHGMKI